MSKIEKAIEWALNIANDSSHGYDQASHWGPNYDCSSLVISAWQEAAGVPVKTKGATYTGNMKAVFLKCGFENVVNKAGVVLSTGAGLKRGDILLHERNHTAMYLGNGRIVQASINERGGITGGQSGDQTGGEILVQLPLGCGAALCRGECHRGTYVESRGRCIQYGNMYSYPSPSAARQHRHECESVADHPEIPRLCAA